MKILYCLLLLPFCFLSQDKNIQPALSDWMSQTIDQSKTLKEITLPGAHDASIFQCFDCTVGANKKNTQTQYLPVENLLDSGIRYFDLRPILDEGVFYTGHFTKYHKRPSFGCKGDTMKRIFSEINKFLEKHNELVILHFSHYCDRGWNHADKNFLAAFLTLLSATLEDKLFCTQDSLLRVSDLPLSKILSGKKGKVIVIMNNYKGNVVSDKRAGFFSSSKDITLFDKYSNTVLVDFMIGNQKEKIISWLGNDTLKREEIFVMPWTLTQNTRAAMRCAGIKWPWKKCVSITKMAEDAKSRLSLTLKTWQNELLISKAKKPNIITVDIGDGIVTRVCLWLNGL
jgi:hypothetical protein